jgi:hypothetical protein
MARKSKSKGRDNIIKFPRPYTITLPSTARHPVQRVTITRHPVPPLPEAKAPEPTPTGGWCTPSPGEPARSDTNPESCQEVVTAASGPSTAAAPRGAADPPSGPSPATATNVAVDLPAQTDSLSHRSVPPHPRDLYGLLKSWACEENPDDLKAAFRALCRYARIYADPDTMSLSSGPPIFGTWATPRLCACSRGWTQMHSFAGTLLSRLPSSRCESLRGESITKPRAKGLGPIFQAHPAISAW